MFKNHFNTQSQTAQSMVEFALVLPVLMLIILGIFAFGHFFFTYSSVVSASREAARWGAAVGESTNPYPRYKDCDAIRDAAVRVGSFAGVSRPSVTITYDKGPDDTTSPKPDCPMADGSQGPDVALGNRINVNVTVQYTPIVPFLQLPSFPVTATTSRTILLSLPVGEVPKANALYPTTSLNVTVNSSVVVLDDPGSSSYVNQVFPIAVTVISSDGTTPTGKVEIIDETGQTCGYIVLDATGSAQCNTFYYTAVTTNAAGVNTPHKIYIRYLPGTALYNPSQVTVNHTVAQATSTTTITAITNASGTPVTQGPPNQTVTVVVHVAPEYTAPLFSGVPSGRVELRLSDLTTVVASGYLNSSGSASLSFLPSWTGMNTLTAFYAGDLNFAASSSGASNYTVVALDVNLYPQPTESTVGSKITFTVLVNPANGSVGTPTGSVLIFETNNAAHSCTATLSSGSGSCLLDAFSTTGKYGMTVKYMSGDLNYKDKTITYDLSIINKIATTVALSPVTSTVPPNTPTTFSATVTQADSKNPSGTVTITSSLGPSYTCSFTLKNNNPTGSCQIPGMPFGGPYTFLATFTPTDTANISSSISNTATVTVSSKCPTAANVNILDSSLQFEVRNTSPNNVALNVNEVSVDWANVPPNLLKDFVFVENPSSSSCTVNGTDNICLWQYAKQNSTDVGVSNPPQRFGPNKSGWDPSLANIAQGQTKVFRLDFSNVLGAGNTIQITFDQGCTLSVTK